MSDQRKGGIAWCDETWNPLRGCSKVSAGCDNCYAEGMAKRFCKVGEPFAGTITDGNWNGTVRLIEEKLLDPLRWKRPRRIFVNSVSDVFHPNVPDEWVDRIFAVMALCPQHTFQILTKRPERMREYCTSRQRVWLWDFPARYKNDAFLGMAFRAMIPLPNVWLGVSIENQQAANERIPHLLATPAALRFLSCEPLLGVVDLPGRHGRDITDEGTFDIIGIDWVIVGGESGPHARPMHPDWVRSLRDQCAEAAVKFMFKGWGEWAPESSVSMDGSPGCDSFIRNAEVHFTGRERLYRVGKAKAGRLLDGVEHMAMPEVKS